MQTKLTQTISYSKALVLIIVLSIFSKELFTYYINDFGIDFFGYLSCIFIFLVYFKNFKTYTKLIYFLVFVFLTALCSVFIFNMPLFPVIKTFIPVVIIYTSNYYVLQKNNQWLDRIAKLYIKIAYYTAILGLLQFVLSIFGISILGGSLGRGIDSIAYEPSHYAAVIMPAVILTILQFKKYKLKAIILITALIGTVSLSAYLVLLLVISFYFVNRYKFVFILPLILLSIQFLNNSNSSFNDRFQSSQNVLNGRVDITKANLTVLSFGTNLEVALFSIKKNPVWGSGIGGHKTMYDRYYKNSEFKNSDAYGINNVSAHSLFIRIVSEFGIIGFIVYILMFLRLYIKKSKDKFHHIIFLACLSHFLVKLFKLGGYIDYGTPFFMCLLIVNYLVYKSKIKPINIISK